MSDIEKLWIEYFLTGFAVQRVRWDEPTQEAQACDKGPTSTIEDSPRNPQGLSVVGREYAATRTERSEGQDS